MTRLWTKPFIMLTAGMLFLGTGFYLLLPTLPLYIKQLGGNDAMIGLVAGIFTLAAVVFRLFVGGLLDRYGRRPFMLLGLLLFGISIYAYEWAGGIAVLIALRIVHGAGWAFSTTAIGTSITDVVPEKRRGEGMGWYGVSMTVSMAIGPMLGTWIIMNYSFSHMFGIAAAFSAMALALAFAAKIPFQPHANKGSISLIEKSLLPVMAGLFFLAVSYGGITAFMPIFADTIAVNPGFFFLVYAVSLTVIRPVAGKLSDRYGETAIIIPSLIITFLALIVVSQAGNMAGVAVSAVLYGIGFGSAQPAFQSVALKLAPPDRKGVANASFFTAFDLGIGLGSIALGSLSLYIGYQGVFAASAVSVACSLVIFVSTVRKARSRTPAKTG
ncbi:MFS transporter [Paenibacillus hemerocallicola]|uniref:MFS transporter n=1 Tax=Paenibacillus hemerocallicola TaxID=1172614 RepID=A0A5C4SZP3_9BACL|nr:MFS transporter [Paenibacillus hemerocallicola]TNJ62244.1 MFS transporter [Paenibacillus hemerocallicola]